LRVVSGNGVCGGGQEGRAKHAGDGAETRAAAAASATTSVKAIEELEKTERLNEEEEEQGKALHKLVVQEALTLLPSQLQVQYLGSERLQESCRRTGWWLGLRGYDCQLVS
jgi:hypothetical protein